MIEVEEAPEHLRGEITQPEAGSSSPSRPMSDPDNNQTENVDGPQKIGDFPRNTPPPVYDESLDPSTNNENSELPKDKHALVDSSNFWLVGNYKKIVKKVEDGAKFCDELSQMIAERAEIENLYAKKLQAWNKKWLASLSKGLEYGSLLESIRKGLDESNNIADLHLAMQGRVSEVSNYIQSWRTDNYHKGLIGLKEAKKTEEGFAKGQKPWAKKYNDVLKGKQSYHSSCQSLEIAKQQENELKSNREETTQDQLMKIQSKVKKATQDRDTALENYKEALRDIGNYNQKYKEDMIYEYDKWEKSEMKRKELVLGKIKEFKDCIDITRFQPKMVEIYSKLTEDYQIANPSNDVQWYRKRFGPDVQFIDISFVEYDPESNLLTKGKQNLDTNQNVETKNGKTKEKSKVCVAL